MQTELMEAPHDKPLNKEQMVAQVRTVQDVMHTVMKDGEHYGIIPGCGNKPTLLKAGAEKLLHTFGFSTRLEVIPMFPGEEERVGYRVLCEVLTRDGRLMGTGVGEASSEEEKWKWREAICPEQWEEAMDDQRRKKWKKWNGKTETVLQVKNNPYDLSNTILKMAKKRAQVDATLTVCACSDIFTQDIEEMGGEVKSQSASVSRSTVPTAPPFGEFAGQPLTDIPDHGLVKYMEYLAKTVKDPKKAQYKKNNEKALAQFEAEVTKREAHMATASNPISSFSPEPQEPSMTMHYPEGSAAADIADEEWDKAHPMTPDESEIYTDPNIDNYENEFSLGTTVRGFVTKITSKSGKSAKGPWEKTTFIIKPREGPEITCSTFAAPMHFHLRTFQEVYQTGVLFTCVEGDEFPKNSGKHPLVLESIALDPLWSDPDAVGKLQPPSQGEYQAGPPQDEEEAEQMSLMGRGE